MFLAQEEENAPIDITRFRANPPRRRAGLYARAGAPGHSQSCLSRPFGNDPFRAYQELGALPLSPGKGGFAE
jgi:hypothetical protein